MPTVVVAGCLTLALVLIESHTWVDVELAEEWPRLFGAGTDGAREMLYAIAVVELQHNRASHEGTLRVVSTDCASG